MRNTVRWILPGFISLACAQAPEPPSAAEPPLDEVLVTGEFPGPGLWKVTRRGDASGHVLWIVGDPWPLPKRMKWKSKEIEATVAGAQEILRDATVSMASDEKIGFFRGMALLPAMLEARRNPDDARLEDLLPPELYARWLVQKKRYLGRERGIESWRPLFAADKLRKAAFRDLGMREGGAVWDVVGKLAGKHRIKVTVPTLKFTFRRSELRDKLKEFSRESLADQECFATTLDLTEALARREVEQARARAWATGDLEALAALPVLPSPYLPCVMSVMNAQVARELVPADIRQRVFDLWIAEAERSLAANQRTFAIVPFGKLTRADGYLARLREKGYEVEPPR
jgi:hypothetical protein